MKLNISELLKGAGNIASVINPAIGSGLMLAGAVADEFDGVSDDELENKFIGLGKSAEILEEIAKKNTLTNNDRQMLLMVSSNLEGINTMLEKIVKLFK